MASDIRRLMYLPKPIRLVSCAFHISSKNEIRYSAPYASPKTNSVGEGGFTENVAYGSLLWISHPPRGRLKERFLEVAFPFPFSFAREPELRRTIFHYVLRCRPVCVKKEVAKSAHKTPPPCITNISGAQTPGSGTGVRCAREARQ